MSKKFIFYVKTKKKLKDMSQPFLNLLLSNVKENWKIYVAFSEYMNFS